MPCTTILVGKNASNDRSTMIARTDDGHFDVKKLVVVEPKDQKKKYTSVISHLTVDLPEEPLRYTACPSVDPKNGVWAATGINAANVGMTATETITTNPRVLAADPLVVYKKAAKRGEKDVPGGIGEEDMLVLVLPYIRTAREGVLRLGKLLETYGTYECNGVAFNDENEVWWLETVGGHHWLAKRVPDDRCIIAPNQFAMDDFDLDDALGAQQAHLCSEDLLTFIHDDRLDCNQAGRFDPRAVFGSRRDMDHIYNTPRAWFMGRYLCPFSHRWEGPDAEYGPESDDIPWALVPDRKITVEDVKYLLSSHYQGTDYDPYIHRDTGKRGMYRSIGINRTGVAAVCQIRSHVPDPIKGLEWVCFGPTTFDALLPVYPNVPRMPAYLARVTMNVSTENFYWASRLLATLCDPHFARTVQPLERYQNAVMARGRQLVRTYDRRMTDSGDFSLAAEANDALAKMAREETDKALNTLVLIASETMKDGYDLADN